MAQEEHAQKKNSNSGSSGGGEVGSFKKMKQKKVPQRGLGVAQLEKIRLEEQQKKEAALQQAATSNVLTPPSNSSSGLAVQCPTFRPSISSSTSVPPLLPQSATDHLSSLNSMFRPPPHQPTPPIPNIEILHPKPVPLSKPLNVSGGEIGWSAPAPTPAPAPASWSKVWIGEYSLEGENQRLDHYGLKYHPNANMSHASTTPFVPLPNIMQRSSQIQQPSPSSMVNISTEISSSPVMNFQMEPPSNQNIPATNNYPPLWPDEEKMIGVKRPYPFSIETPPAPAFHFKCPLTYVAPPSRLDEAASCSNRNNVSTNRGFAVTREYPARPNTMSEPSKLELRDRERGGLNGDFLTLAPPTISSPHSSLKHKQSLANTGLHNRELSEYHHPHPSHQGSTEDAVQGQGSSKPIHELPFYSFFPSPKKKQQQQIGHSSTTLANNHNCSNATDVGENIDLSLKL